MPRVSAWNGSRIPNARPTIVIAPDAYVSIQGETTILGCGECKRKINFNQYLTSVSTDASVDSPPGNASVNLTIPDTDVNDFYLENQFAIIPMMEIEIYAKGYFLVGGVPQYYKIFWGIISSVSTSWSNGVTTVSISCRDILRWWELTQISINPAFLDAQGSTAGGYQLFQNQFAGMNPYTVIISLAKEAMGDWSKTVGSFLSFKPEEGENKKYSSAVLSDVMLYWQAKFGNIWNNLVLYGASGNIYTTAGNGGTISTIDLSQKIFEQEFKLRRDQSEANALFKLAPNEIAVWKREIARAGEVDFFQNDVMSKLAIANQAKDQIGYEFYCDPCGDIVFKPPFYNLNVLPNKPVSWIQDIDLIDDNINDSEAEVYTHIVASGNAFGGVTDYGITDEITAPNTGAFDYHLLKRYGWRRYDYNVEWAGNPKKLFYHILDFLDRLNAKRINGNATIPLRPELRLGFPIWFEKYDSFFYISAIAHSFSVGGQATTTLTLTAKRSKFLAPKNIGKITPFGTVQSSQTEVSTSKDQKKNPPRKKTPKTLPSYKIIFPDSSGTTEGSEASAPVILRHPKTGRFLGYPRVVMVYRHGINGEQLARIISSPATKAKVANKGGSVKKSIYAESVSNAFRDAYNADKSILISRIRKNRYEAGATNAGAYDYAEDVEARFIEFEIISIDSLIYEGSTGDDAVIQGLYSKEKDANVEKLRTQIEADQAAIKKLDEEIAQYNRDKLKNDQAITALKKKYKNNPPEEELKALTDEGGMITYRINFANAKKKVYTDSIRVTKIRIGRKIASPSVLIRPVSDEFGFEVVGHYRYGRGAYIDRGKVNIKGAEGSAPANQINVQFAPSGGLLTESVSIKDQSIVDMAASYEKMRPDDWATGASFTFNGVKDPVKDILVTDMNTYTGNINTYVQKGVYIDVDLTRRSRLLSELKPTIDLGNFTTAVADCVCGIGKTTWLGVLPQSVIRTILSPPGSGTSVLVANRDTGNKEAFVSAWQARREELLSTASQAGGNALSIFNNPRDVLLTEARNFGIIAELNPQEQSTTNAANSKGEEILVVTGSVSTHDFFGALNNFLRSEFNRDIKVNQDREQNYSGATMLTSSPAFNSTIAANYSIGGTSLFNRAALGDPEAISAITKDPNLNFGLVDNAINNLNDAANAGLTQLNTSLEELQKTNPNVFVPGKGYGTTTGQPDAPPWAAAKVSPPTVGVFVNETKYAKSIIPI